MTQRTRLTGLADLLARRRPPVRRGWRVAVAVVSVLGAGGTALTLILLLAVAVITQQAVGQPVYERTIQDSTRRLAQRPAHVPFHREAGPVPMQM